MTKFLKSTKYNNYGEIMKKHFILAIRYTFYITALLFFDSNISIIPIIFLISTLFLENKYYSILPIILSLYLKPVYIIILISSFIYHIVLYSFFKRNRFYSLVVYLLSIFTANIIILINNSYNINTLYISLLSIILYGIINCFYVFYNNKNKHYILPLNDRLIHLTILLGYLLLITFYNPNQTLYFFLFMQLFIINDFAYNSIFFIVYVLINLAKYKVLSVIGLQYLAVSYIPPCYIISMDFSNTIDYLYLIYVILLSLLRIKKKKITIENDYISSLFNDFKSYINNLNIEYDRLNTLKELKENHLENIQNTYCKNCSEPSICKYKPDVRYSFLCNAMNNENYNIYSCPNYNNFYLNTNIETRTSFLQFNAITNLANELEYLYTQNIKMAKCYNKLTSDLLFYDYEIINIDINLSSPTTFFSITLSKKKIIIKEIFLKLSYKAFFEALEIKVIENNDNYIVYLYKKPKVKLEYSHKILPKNNNIISGDNYFIKRDYNDSYVFALSDGMGSGHTAYKESSKALKLISHLSTYHFSLKTILKLLENIYDLKCEYDSYATLDLLHINTANMKLNLYKLGSTVTYIFHNDDLMVLENKALPLKLDDINSSYELEYYKNDVILLLSDGVSDFISRLEIKNEVDFSSTSEEILNQLIKKLKEKENNELKDDASIIVIKIV